MRFISFVSLTLAASLCASAEATPLTREAMQSRIDALPISGAPNAGGLVQLSGNTTITTNQPICIPSGVTVDFGNAQITYTGDPRRAAIEFDSSNYGHGFVVEPGISNVRIISTGACIGMSPNAVEVIRPVIANVMVSGGPARYALDFPRRLYYADISNITMYNSGGACIRILGNANTLNRIWCRGQPREGFKLPPEGAMVFLDHDGTAGSGSICGVEVSMTGKEVTWVRYPNNSVPIPQLVPIKTIGVLVRGQYGISGLWSELPAPGPAIQVEGNIGAARVFDPTLLDNRIRAYKGGRVLVEYIRPKIADNWGRVKDMCEADADSKIEVREWPN